MELFHNLAFGFWVAVSPANLLYCALGVLIGTFVGVLPGVGALATILILLPLTFGLDPVTSLIMLAGIYYGAIYGGSTASILVNLPGTPASAVTCLDGYPMAQQGRASTALVMTTIASFFGGLAAMFIVGQLAPMLSNLALSFSAPEYFSLMAVGLLASISVASGGRAKAIGMVLVGILVGCIGTDLSTGTARFTFGMNNLLGGVSLVIVAMGLFGVAEVMFRLEDSKLGAPRQVKVTVRDMVPDRTDLKQSFWAMVRGTGIGALIGVLPGASGTIASYMSYAAEKRVAKDPSRFGKGAIEGIAGPESANNAAAQTAFIPTLTLGIPGDAVMALMLGAMMIHGISPGPNVIVDNADLFWGLVASMFVANAILLVLNLPLVGVWAKVLAIPYRLLYPAILVLVCLGVYTLGNNAFHILMVAAFGALGYVFVLTGCNPAPFLLGMMLGPLVEENLRRALLVARGNPAIFVERPISAAILAVGLIIALAMIRGAWKDARAGRSPSTEPL